MNKDAFKKEIERRRTFAIISHPDAGKTTLTEKLLLYGGAIRLAGAVRSRKASKHATSDWMDIEKQRGISVTSSVMQFEYKNNCINILDTPGHQDFSEDTYRTLMAADSAVMLIDGAKGVEPQTIKLFHVCKTRGIPIFTFVNKMDRASKDPFELMEEIENVLGVNSYPINWPIGIDGDFKGVYDRKEEEILLFEGIKHGQKEAKTNRIAITDSKLSTILDSHYMDRLNDEIELLEGAGDSYNMDKILSGELTPLFFGSAMSNFGVETFLDYFLKMAPTPVPRHTSLGDISPYNENFTAFVFKIQANMNPAHRDRLAFIRICSGKFEKGMTVYHFQGKKEIRLSQPQQFMAQERAIINEAYPGDIIGLFDPGIFAIGDTLTLKNEGFEFDSIPSFSPEFFSRISAKDSMKRKQFTKGMSQLAQEGAVQIFKQVDIGIEEVIVGAVGVLQFEVLVHRLKNEYGVDVNVTSLPLKLARWVKSHNEPLKDLNLSSTTIIAEDRYENKVLLFENTWSCDWSLQKNPGLELTDINK